MSGESAVGSGESAEGEPRRPRPRVSIIVAAAENGVIGREGQLPWRLPADLARFKQLTIGHALVMGRKTYESIGRPLPGRQSIVLSRNANWAAGNAEVSVQTTFPEAIERATDKEVFVIGGGEIYRLALPQTDCVYLTRVHAQVDGDATFPELSKAEWKLVQSEHHKADERNEHAFTFETWQRIHS